MENSKDLVNHPAHYNKPGRKECWDEMIDRYQPAWVCVYDIVTAYKYLYRAGSKDGNDYDQDIAKALAYLKHCRNIAGCLIVQALREKVYAECQRLEKELSEIL